MSKAPAMPMYWDAYLADTTHLTTEEHGAYMLLLAAMWRRNGSVPDDDKDNARILGLTPAKWRKIKARFVATISGFSVDGDVITQEKLQKTWKNTQEKIDKNKQNGAKGGRAAARKNNDLAEANAAISQERKATIPEPEPDPSIREPKGSLSSGDDVQAAFDAYNASALQMGWPQAQKFSPKRKSAIRARLKDANGLDGWSAALAKARASPHCNGDNRRGWVINLDFISNSESFSKLMEGNYDARPHTTTISQFPRRGAEDGKRPDPALEKALRLSGLGEAQSNAGG